MLDAVAREIDLRHLWRMTTDEGMWQHARGAIPEPSFGLCTDDNARALLAVMMHYRLLGDPTVLLLAERYVGFLENAFDPASGLFRNLRSSGGDWLEVSDGDDAHARALWSLAALLDTGDVGELALRAQRLFIAALPATASFRHPRPWAFTILACEHAIRAATDASFVRECLFHCSQRLYSQLRAHASEGWFWFEDQLTYANARLPHALARAGVLLSDSTMVDGAATAMRWLVSQQTTADGVLTIVGNKGWMTQRGMRAQFDQQPIEAMCLVQAALAFAKIEGEVEWLGVAARCYDWFTGANDLGRSMIDPETGGCFDGLTAAGVNLNQGAESLLALLISKLSICSIKLKSGNEV